MIAICSMVRKPFNFDTWIEYHLSLGVDYIFLRVEDTPELNDIIQKYPQVVAEFDTPNDNFNNYWTQINRQEEFIKSLKDKMMKLNINWVFHIDSDELICCNDLKKILNQVPEDYQTIVIRNYEAVYTKDDLENPFLQTNLFKISGHLAYTNGKSASRLNENFLPRGCHIFAGNKLHMSKSIVILHFESPTFERWYQKFQNQSNCDKKLSEIPFDFYKESINLVKNGDKEKARMYYNKMKVNNSSGTLIKLYWTPQLEYKNVTWS